MTAEGVAAVLDILSRLSALVVALLVIVGFVTGRIVSKGHADEIRHELEEAKKARAEALAKLGEDVRRLDEDVRRGYRP